MYITIISELATLLKDEEENRERSSRQPTASAWLSNRSPTDVWTILLAWYNSRVVCADLGTFFND